MWSRQNFKKVIPLFIQTVLSLAVLLFCSIVNIVSMIIKQRNSSTHLNIRKSRAGESLGDSKRRDSNERLTEESKCKLLGRKARFVTRVTRQVPYVEQELSTLPEHLSTLPLYGGVCVARSLVLCAMFRHFFLFSQWRQNLIVR
jgi:hypothetical protein